MFGYEEEIAPKFTPVHAKRLLKLAAFLDTLPRQKFDFSQIATVGEKPMMAALRAGKHQCGTVACAVGWMPAVFPRHFRWDGQQESGYALEVTPRTYDAAGDDDCIGKTAPFFGITGSEASGLFMPSWNADTPDSSATPKEVARHVRRFVKRKQKEAAGG